MDLESFVDTEILYDPIYWLLTAMFVFAVLIGFGGGGFLADMGFSSEANTMIPLWSKILVVVFIPITAYFVVLKIRG